MIRYLGAICWITGIAAGVFWLQLYGVSASDLGDARERWPEDSRLVGPTDHPLLVMFVHPRCPCTRASLVELERMLPDQRDQILLVVGIPANAQNDQNDWTDSYVGRWAVDRNVAVVFDLDGREAKVFGATTSGFSLVYSESGALLFQGGLTASRGHAGRNAGSAAAVEFLKGRRSELDRHSVYGCRLVRRPQSQDQEQ